MARMTKAAREVEAREQLITDLASAETIEQIIELVACLPPADRPVAEIARAIDRIVDKPDALRK